MRDIPGYEGLYAITSCGKVWSHLNNKFLKTRVTKKGYEAVVFTINRKVHNFFVHRLVAITYLNNPNNLSEINHKDKNTLNNSLNNLEWCDRKYNVNYSLAKPIKCVETNEIFKSITDASKKLNCHPASLYDALYKKNRTLFKKHFKFI